MKIQVGAGGCALVPKGLRGEPGPGWGPVGRVRVVVSGPNSWSALGAEADSPRERLWGGTAPRELGLGEDGT